MLLRCLALLPPGEACFRGSDRLRRGIDEAMNVTCSQSPLLVCANAPAVARKKALLPDMWSNSAPAHLPGFGPDTLFRLDAIYILFVYSTFIPPGPSIF